MLKKSLLSMILTILLVACGQGVDQPTETEEYQENAGETEAVSHSSDSSDEADDKATDSDESKQKDDDAETETSTDKQPDNKTSTSLSYLEVHYIDAGQADATLFQYKDENNSYTILYDTGDWNKNDVINYLDAQNVSSIDLVVVSHPHADHIGQLAKVMNTYDVGEVWSSGGESSSHTFQQAMEAVLASDADYDEPRAGDEMEIGPMDIEVLHPSSLTGDLNKDSISLRFTYGDISFVFTGDAYKEDELAMMNKAETIEATILQLGHHGSDTSSDPTFIQAVDPDVAIYSASADNAYGPPHPKVVSLIQDAGITLYGTNIHGTILETTDGKEYDVATKEDGTITPESTGAPDNGAQQETEIEDEAAPNNETPTDQCVDLNQASLEDLQEIIHIGPARAKDVIDQRPYDAVDDLTKINGIGPARIADIENEGFACTGG